MQDRIAHAKAYPFPRLDHCFLYTDEAVSRLDHAAHPTDALRDEGRVPVLAAGSNQSPEQLRRKYRETMPGQVIPARRGMLGDFDVVYAAHLTAYGSVPATFQHAPGTRVTVYALWLTEEQLDRMHATEGNYTYDRLTGLDLVLDGTGEVLDEAYVYSSRVGCLDHDGGCVALTEIAAENRTLPQKSQPEMLAWLGERLAPGTPLDDFIAAHLADRDLHRARSTRLGQGAHPIRYPRETILDIP